MDNHQRKTAFFGGRVCLGGEGLGLYRGKALTISTSTFGIQISNSQRGCEQQFSKEIEAVVQSFAHAGYKVTPPFLDIKSTIPSGFGLASSAALMYAITVTLSEVLLVPCTPTELEDIAYYAERYILGVLVGKTDTYAVARRGILFQDHSSDPSHIEPLGSFFTGYTLFVLGAEPSHYAEIGRQIKEKYRLGDGGMKRYQTCVAEQVSQLRTATTLSDVETFHAATERLYSSLKNDLGIENPDYEYLREIAYASGAVSSKNIGIRGSGGSVYALVPDHGVDRFLNTTLNKARFVYPVVIDK